MKRTDCSEGVASIVSPLFRYSSRMATGMRPKTCSHRNE